MKIWNKKILLFFIKPLNILLFNIILFCALLFWLIFFESGLKSLFYVAQSFIPGELQIANIEGTLSKGFVLQNCNYQFKNGQFSAQTIKIKNDELFCDNTFIQYGPLFLELKSIINNEKANRNKSYKYNINGSISNEKNPIDFTGTLVFDNDHSLKINLDDLNFILNKKKVIHFNAEVILPNLNFNFVQLFFNGIQNLMTKRNFFENEIQGKYKAKLNDYSLIYRFLPDISRLKADIETYGEINGNLQNPIITINTEINNAIFSIPKQHITVKQFNAKLFGVLNNELTLESKGLLGGNPFYIQGKINPFIKDKKGHFELKGKDIRVFNTDEVKVIISPDLKLVLQNNRIDVKGDVYINEADITVKDKMNNIVYSKDVVWINVKEKNNYDSANNNHRSPKNTSNNQKENDDNSNPIQINPHIHLIIEDNVKFKGYGLDADVRGNLIINQRQDGVYTAEGRVTFVKGKYRLPGGLGYIDRGHLFYPKGTLLTDPSLDIRVIQKHKANLNDDKDVGVYVQGTLQKPVYHLFSNQQLDQSKILSELGVGGREVEGNDNQWLSKSAALLGGGANPIVSNLQERLGLEEFGIQTRDTTKFVTTQEATDTALVVGKSLTDRIYLQFIQGMLVPTSTLRLQYLFNPNVAGSIETSTSGLGGDLSFSIED